MSNKIKVALAGNPNCGKTTVFNMLTGAKQKVANYPGVTVEKKSGTCRYEDKLIEVVDLPGTYCLSAYSEEELVARHFILNEKPDVVVDIIDASNIERNLYLAVQLIEMRVPLLLVLNMADVARKKGLVFDIAQLEKLLGVKIIETVASKEEGRDELLGAIVQSWQNKTPMLATVHYGKEIDDEIKKIRQLIEENHLPIAEKYDKNWVALKLLEQDEEILKACKSEAVAGAVEKGAKYIRDIFGDEPEIIIADRRYGFISGACQETVKSTIEARHDFSDKIDAVLTHRVLGLPLFIVMMYAVFQLVFIIGGWPVTLLEHLFGWMGQGITNIWPTGPESILLSLVVDGIIGGVGGVVAFLPNILILFAAIAILEDTGYMARAAFIMDRIMHKIGLHGKSFIPMLIGFGCSVPAIMATRILENKRNRLTTIMITPLMSCGARFPIYALLIPAFFPIKFQGPILWMLYLTGIVIAIVTAKILRHTIFRGETVPFVMELPPYRIPTLKGVMIHTWDRGKLYLQKAGTIILALSLLLWAATIFPRVDMSKYQGQKLSEQQIQQLTLTHSVLGRAGKIIEPAIKPLGFDWKIGTALIGALGAKEVFVSQLGIVYSLGDNEANSHTLQSTLRADYSPLQGLCVMLFCLISAPCFATLAITSKETGSWLWGAFQFILLTVIAYVLTLIVYQIGSLLEIGNKVIGA